MNSTLNFGMVPGINQALGMSQFGGNMFGSMGAHQFVIDKIRKQQQAAASPQNVPANITSPDANSVSATGFSSMGGEMYADPSVQLATGNAPDNTITAGMAMGNAPIATVGGFNPSATATAEGIYGSEIARSNSISPKKLITL